MANKTYQIARLDDVALVQLLDDAETAAQKAAEAQEKTLGACGVTLKRTTRSIFGWLPDPAPDAEPGGYAISSADLAVTLSGVSLNQGDRQTQPLTLNFSISRETKDQWDRFGVSHPEFNGQLPSRAAPVIDAIYRVFARTLKTFAPGDTSFESVTASLVQNLESTSRRIDTDLSQALAAVQQERVALSRQMAEERAAQNQALAAERAQMLAEIRSLRETAEGEIAARHEDLRAERAELDIASHKDARRQQFAKLQEELQGSIAMPTAAAGQGAVRLLVFFALIGGAVAAGVFAHDAIRSGAQAAGDSGVLVLTILRSVLLAGASLGGFFGAAAWLRYFYNRDLAAQEDLRRFRNDMARASWIMEAAMEIRTEHKEDIPPEWIAGVTRDLFGAGRTPPEEGAQALSALMGLSAAARVGPEGLSVDLNRRGTRALAQAGQAD